MKYVGAPPINAEQKKQHVDYILNSFQISPYVQASERHLTGNVNKSLLEASVVVGSLLL
jgi:hypothetical protein